MLFNYKVSTKDGGIQNGSIDAPSVDIAISSLQKRGFTIIDVRADVPIGETAARLTNLFRPISQRDIVVLSRQIATLFEAKVSVLTTFELLASEAPNPQLQQILIQTADDIKGGLPISSALARHPRVFSTFYISMVKSGEESGKLSETFNFMADYLERSYELTSRARNALVYPAFVVVSFVVVIIVLMTYVIPKLTEIIVETGQELPIYTRIIIGTSNFFVDYGLFLLIGLILLILFMMKYTPTAIGQATVSRFKLALPLFGDLYRKLYLSRVSDNLNTLLVSGVSMDRSLEITAEVVDNLVYREAINDISEMVRGGSALSDAFARYPELFPGIIVQMARVGEETGKLGFVLDTMARFYRREVNNAVDTLVGLIEPLMIVVLGLMVGFLLVAVLVPIYNVASNL